MLRLVNDQHGRIAVTPSFDEELIQLEKILTRCGCHSLASKILKHKT